MLGMWPLFWPAVAFLAAAVVALLLRSMLTRALRRWLGPAQVETFLRAIRLPSILWCLVLGLFVAIEVVEMPRRLATQLHNILEAAIILSVTVTVAGVLSSLAAAAGERRALGMGMTGLVRTAVRGAILVIGGLVLLGSLGVQITPLLTALGVGGLAVALALQDTLSNLFAGVHLLADKPIRFGEYALEFTLGCHVASFVDQYEVQHELRKRILRRFRAEGIEIPYPIRMIETRPGGGEPPSPSPPRSAC